MKRQVNKFMIILIVVLLTIVPDSFALAPKNNIDPGALKTFGTMGKERKILEKGKEVELFSHNGKGALTHMWFGGGFKSLGQTRLRIYVDDEEYPSIDMEIYLGHGIGFNQPEAPWGIERIGILGEQGGVYNTYRIPFGQNVRITAQLSDEEEHDKPPFWWIVRGTENLPVVVGGVELPEEARLKLYTRENYTADILEEFDLCNTSKSGALYKVTMAARSENLNYMEACVRGYTEGDKLLWLSSGLEDYFLGTYYFQTGKFYNPVAGLTYFNPEESAFCAYRFHEADPVFFQNGFRLTARVGEELDGKKMFDPQPTTYWTYTWVYEWE